ncbi:MAG: hypothetical protein R3C60_04625 [Parvularculaceae bacterium]
MRRLIAFILAPAVLSGFSNYLPFHAPECQPSAESRLLVGTWYGKFELDGDQIEFIDRRSPDQTYFLENRSTSSGEEKIDVENGRWRICQGKFWTLPDNRREAEFDYFVYDVISVEKDKFVYRDNGLEVTFTAVRVPDNFQFPAVTPNP